MNKHLYCTDIMHQFVCKKCDAALAFFAEEFRGEILFHWMDMVNTNWEVDMMYNACEISNEDYKFREILK